MRSRKCWPSQGDGSVTDEGFRMLRTRAQIAQRVGELGADIAGSLRGQPPEDVLFVGVLKGSSVFLADLIRAIPLNLRVDFISISSYAADGAGSGVVRIVKDLELPIDNKHVLLVEDIVDTGLTLTYLRKTLLARSPASLKTVTLIDKAARRLLPVPVDWVGFEAPDEFLLGYGLDYRGIYRNVPDLLSVPEVALLAKEPRKFVERLYPAT